MAFPYNTKIKTTKVMPLCLITGHRRNMKWFKVTNLTRRFKNVCGWSFQRRVLCRKCQVRVSTTRYTGTSTHSTVAARASGMAVAKATVTGSLPKKSARMFAYGHLTKVKMAMIYLKPYLWGTSCDWEIKKEHHITTRNHPFILFVLIHFNLHLISFGPFHR